MKLVDDPQKIFGLSKGLIGGYEVYMLTHVVDDSTLTAQSADRDYQRRDKGAHLKRDLRVSRIGPGGFPKAFYLLLLGVILQRHAVVRKKGGTSTLEYIGELYAAFRTDETLPKKNLTILSQLVGRRSYDLLLGQVQDGPHAPGKIIEEAYDSFMHAPLDSEGYNSPIHVADTKIPRIHKGNHRASPSMKR
ncbi:hypothetical protein RJ640_027679 [Escallonia rubra]|uniref:Uncharacterized protein n=1 Tax=Escallonia rubra TaxID=112253 RepID=A0AA88S0Q1_9ASTE|nr:hypothetical protein RJ640_027679 [Escallonia rubra]